MTDTTPKELVEVTQTDRNAAAALIKARPLVENADIILHAGADDGAFVQAFARHRIEALSTPNPKVGELADELERCRVDRGIGERVTIPLVLRDRILTALRSIPEDGVERSQQVQDTIDELGWPQPSPETCRRAAAMLSALSSSSDIPGERNE